MDIGLEWYSVDKLFYSSPRVKNNFLKFSVLHNAQMSFFLEEVLIAFGWSIDRPSSSHRSCCRVISFASEELRGHWNRPSPSNLFCNKIQLSRS